MCNSSGWNQSLISRSASGLSPEVCTRFGIALLWMFAESAECVDRSPLMVPGIARLGRVAPAILRAVSMA